MERDAAMHILTEENIRKVGFKRSLVANGKDNMRHFTAIMKYGTLAYLYLTATDAGEALFWSKGARNEENHAEFEADARAYSIYTYLNFLNMFKDWKCLRNKYKYFGTYTSATDMSIYV